MTAKQRAALTDRQRAILCFISDYIEEKGYPPTIREIGAGTGGARVSTIHSHLQSLQLKGYIRVDGGPRTIVVIDE